MSFLKTFIREGWPPKPTFSPSDIPDLGGRVAIVTGASSGIGTETAKALLEHGARVYLACRDKVKTDAVISALQRTTGKTALFLELDLASLKSVKRAAEEFQAKETRLDILINNAGLMWTPMKELTQEKYDLQFGVAVIGHFYFTKLLLPTLLASNKESPQTPSRVVHVSSIGHHLTKGLQFEAFKDGAYRNQNVSSAEMYSEAKLGNILISNEFARRYGDQGLVSISLNPGNLKTDLMRTTGFVEKTILNWIQHPAQIGALSSLYAATMPEAAKLNGKYLVPWAQVGTPSLAAQNQESAEKLWNWLEDEVKVNGN
ncbi:NAD-binding protein [Flagelloscypha sp. PMI_526]|nr:NAD-binding protein [Flagelloscypha sp. PMI_526]